MCVVIKDVIRRARKHYACDAYEAWRDAGGRKEDCHTPDGVLILEAVEADGGKILPGQQYRYVRLVGEGTIYTWRERVDMGNLLHQMQGWEDE